MELKANTVPYDIPVPNNMGIVRYVMAFSVLIAHFNLLDHADIYGPVSSYNAVGGFFAISGFLMAGSYLKRPDWKQYLFSRGRRILPSYFSTVLFFALILFFFSSSSNYFFSGHFWKYLISNLCFLNFLEPSLPGVFEGLEMSAVNGSLWTMKVEWMLYISLPFVSYALCRWKNRSLAIIVAVYLISMIYRIVFSSLYMSSGKEIYGILSRQFIGQLMFFYSGVLVYYYFDVFMRWRWWILAVCLTLLITLHRFNFFVLTLEPLMISLVTLWFCMVGRWGAWEARYQNISYNIYLVHFPVCQLAAQFLLTERLGAWTSFTIVTAVTVLLSWLINVLVERPLKRLYARR